MRVLLGDESWSRSGRWERDSSICPPQSHKLETADTNSCSTTREKGGEVIFVVAFGLTLLIYSSDKENYLNNKTALQIRAHRQYAASLEETHYQVKWLVFFDLSYLDHNIKGIVWHFRKHPFLLLSFQELCNHSYVHTVNMKARLCNSTATSGNSRTLAHLILLTIAGKHKARTERKGSTWVSCIWLIWLLWRKTSEATAVLLWNGFRFCQKC